jgi:hypothetical protein
VSATLNDLTPTASKWFTAGGEYQAYGKAQFLSPGGSIEGPTTIRFDELGEIKIEMNVANLRCDRPLMLELPEYQLEEFLSGETPQPTPNGKGLVMGFGGEYKNECVELKVETEQGVFSTEGKILLWTGRDSVTFHAIRSSFAVKGAGAPKYWVIPLANFLSGFHQRHPELDCHPLRIFSTPAIPSGLSEIDRVLARQNEKNELIIFRFKDHLGFIERLPDYEDRKKSLLEGNVQRNVTSVMVGEVDNSSIEFKDLESWFPFDFFLLLGIATGSEIGAPWVEFRDANGNLVRRAHFNLGSPAFLRGHAAIPEIISDATGRLLTVASASSHWNTDNLGVAMKQILFAGLDGLPVEDRLSHAFRALDKLCEGFGLKKAQDLTNSVNQTGRGAITKSIAQVKQDIRAVLNESRASGNTEEEKAINRIIERITTATIVETGFGKALLALLKQFDLPDGEILERHYELKPRPDGRKWPELLSMFRGTVMHAGYFDLKTSDDDIMSLYHVLLHLHDIVVRIVLKMLGYDGPYSPAVLEYVSCEPVDWVKPDTSPRKLGYK